ncbi:MAG: hypothetical protein KGZ33_00965 [Alkaliphilus sp.]|nr:hypothetical protein [Alkaliphilus sp.]
MAKEKIESKEKKSLGTGKTIIIVISVFTFLPITIMSMLYFISDDFKYIANDYLSVMPGTLGQYFNNYPTREEKETQKIEVAEHLITLEPNSAADKLLIIQNSSMVLYGEIIELMDQMNTQRTEEIHEKLRERSIKDNVLVSTINQFRNDELNQIKQKSSYYENINAHDAATEINTNLLAEIVSYRELASIIEQMNEENAVRILNKLDEEVSENIISNIPNKGKKEMISDMIRKERIRRSQLISKAQIYNLENPDKLVPSLGSNAKYKNDELSLIYRNMDILNGGKILSKVEDEEFLHSLFEQLKKDEMFEKSQTSFTQELISATNIFREYEDRVNEFIDICTKMETQQIVELIGNLYNSVNAPQRHVINDNLSINISDRDLAISIIGRLNPKLVADVLSNMDAVTASEISKSLALP